MQVMKKCLIAAVGVALALPVGEAFAQSGDDMAYCQALSNLVRTINRGADPRADIGTALAQCQTGTPPLGIPVMESFLNDRRVSLPPRGPAMSKPPFDPKMYRNMAECLTAASAAGAPLAVCNPKPGM